MRKSGIPMGAVLLALALFVGRLPAAPEVSAFTLDTLDQWDEMDRREVSGYIRKARAAADNERFDKAADYLREARKHGVARAEVEMAEAYVAGKRRERDARIAAGRPGSSSPSSSSGSVASSSGSERGVIIVTFQTGGFVSLTVDQYTVTIKRTADLNGNSVWDDPQSKRGGRGFFSDPAAFQYLLLGYYTIETIGTKSGQKLYHAAWNNILHECGQTHITIYGDGQMPYRYCVR